MAEAAAPRNEIREANIMTAGKTVAVVHKHAGCRMILENGADDYHINGGVKGRHGGRYVKFTNHMAKLPDTPEWRAAFEAHPDFNVNAFYSGDLAAAATGIPVGGGGVQVVDGTQTAGARPTAPPIPGWDEMGPREIRPLIVAGQVGQPEAALMYEMGHKRRSQVMTALSQAIARDGGEEPSAESTAAEQSVAVPSEGVA